VDYATAYAGGEALKAIGGDPVPHIAEHFRYADPEVTLLVLWSMGGISRRGADAFPVFVEKMEAYDFGIRMGADAVLDGSYPDMSYVISVLTEVLETDIPVARQYAIFVIGMLSPEPKEVVPIIIETLSDEDPFVRASAASVLGCMAPGTVDNIPQLIELLDDEHGYVYASAAYALSFMGKAASEALPKLRELLEVEKEKSINQERKPIYYQIEDAIKRIELGRYRLYP
jgi:HEAT repeat protein